MDCDDWRENLEIGDIVDVKDVSRDDKWYECMIRFVYPEDSHNFGSCIIHYLGRQSRYDEIIDMYVETRLERRSTHTRGPKTDYDDKFQ